MNATTLIPLILTGAGTGLGCGISCGACGNPMTNAFLAGYLFTHTNKLKKTLTSFCGYHLGKAVTVSLLCLLVSVFGSSIADENGRFFGIDLTFIVNVLMLVFVTVMLAKWVRDFIHRRDKGCHGDCKPNAKRPKNGFIPMSIYGAVSGMSPCASLLLVLSYSSALSAGEAILVGLSFSLANSVIPLVLLTALTGLLSEQMYREIPDKIRYLQLAVYLVFAVVLIKNLLS